MTDSFGRAIDDAIAEFQQQLAAERERELAKMRAIIAVLQEMSRKIAQMRLEGALGDQRLDVELRRRAQRCNAQGHQ